MGKAFYQFFVLLAVFFATWFLLSRINFMKRLHVEQINEKTEKKIGDFILKTVYAQQSVIGNDSLNELMNRVKFTLCQDSAEAKKINILIIDDDEVNAFSLPGNTIVVNSALIAHCDSPSELAGVLAHELGHLRLHHVMKKLGNEIGISLLLATASSGNAQIIRDIIHKLSSTAFEREMENDADASAISYLEKARINPAGLPDFLAKLAELKSGTSAAPEWISTHPDLLKRVRTLRALLPKQAITYEQVLNDAEWNYFKENSQSDLDSDDSK